MCLFVRVAEHNIDELAAEADSSRWWSGV